MVPIDLLLICPFKMESIKDIKTLINRNAFMCSIDLTDAFFSIPLHDESRKFVTFEFDGHRYSFNVLPFGMNSSPRIFSKVLRLGIIHLRSLNIKVTQYYDDIFLCAASSSVLETIVHVIVLLRNLGFHINFEKSSLVPSHTLLHLGYL